jgi:hypothetical protein
MELGPCNDISGGLGWNRIVAMSVTIGQHFEVCSSFRMGDPLPDSTSLTPVLAWDLQKMRAGNAKAIQTT